MLFRLLLWFAGVMLWCASRCSSRVQAQLARDISITFGSADGVVRTYVIKNRRINSYAGDNENSLSAVFYKTASQGFSILLAKDAIKQLLDGLANREIELRGEASAVLWFYELLMALFPWNKPNLKVMPDPYLVPDPNSKVADRITREPVAESLDMSWPGAVRAREEQVMWRVGVGDPVPGKPKNFPWVARSPLDRSPQDEEKQS